MKFGRQLAGGAALVLLAALALTAGGCGQSEDKGKGTQGKPDAKATKPESKETPTFLTIPNMTDEGCAANVKGALTKIEGVADVQCDLKTQTVKVLPKPGVVLSPKALWEAADASGENPSKLDGPSGLFTSKPKE